MLDGSSICAATSMQLSGAQSNTPLMYRGSWTWSPQSPWGLTLMLARTWYWIVGSVRELMLICTAAPGSKPFTDTPTGTPFQRPVLSGHTVIIGSRSVGIDASTEVMPLSPGPPSSTAPMDAPGTM